MTVTSATLTSVQVTPFAPSIPVGYSLRMQATGSKDLSPGLSLAGISVRRQSGPATGGGAQAQPAFSNVRVNDPSQDTHQIDQTTQSETAIAVAGSHVAVGYNDSQQSGLFLTAGSDLGFLIGGANQALKTLRIG